MIEFNYMSVISQAQELEQISEQLVLLIDCLKAQCAELQAVWKGESADLFMKKTSELFKDMYKTTKTAADTAAGVNSAAKAIKAAEDAAKIIIKTVTR